MPKESKLKRHLKTLAPPEWKRFGDFVHSPFHNAHTETTRLFDAISAFHPHFQYADAAIFQAAFPGRPFDHARLKVLKTYLLKLLYQFWKHQKLEQDAYLQERFLVEELTDRGLLTEASKMIQRSPLRQSPASSPHIAEHNYHLIRRSLDLHIRDQNRTQAFDFEALIASLDVFALSLKLRIISSQIANSFSQPQTLPEHEIQSTLERVKQGGFDQLPAIGPYYILIQLMRGTAHNEAALVEALLHMLSAGHSNWDKDDLCNVFALLLNKYFVDLGKGIAQSRESILHTYQEMARRDLIFGQGLFSVVSCRNIVSIGSRLGQFEFAGQILEAARRRLPLEYRENIYHHGMAQLAFHQGQFREAKKHLLRVEYFDVIYKLINDILLLRTYFELNDEEGFYALYPTINRFLNRQKGLAESYVLTRKNFLRATRKMFAFRNRRQSRKDGEELRSAVEGHRPAIMIDWIDAKLAELSPQNH